MTRRCHAGRNRRCRMPPAPPGRRRTTRTGRTRHPSRPAARVDDERADALGGVRRRRLAQGEREAVTPRLGVVDRHLDRRALVPRVVGARRPADPLGVVVHEGGGVVRRGGSARRRRRAGGRRRGPGRARRDRGRCRLRDRRRAAAVPEREHHRGDDRDDRTGGDHGPHRPFTRQHAGRRLPMQDGTRGRGRVVGRQGGIPRRRVRHVVGARGNVQHRSPSWGTRP